MFYQITQTDWEMQELPSIMIGNEQSVIDYVNEMNEGADKLITEFYDAKCWLEDNGYEVEKRKDLLERLQTNKIVVIQ